MANLFDSPTNPIVLGSAIYHLIMGTGCLIGPRLIQKFLHKLYAIKFTEKWQDSHEFLMKPIGGFALWTGFICALAIAQPGPWVIGLKYALAILFAFRAVLRIVYRKLFLEWMGVPWSRSRWNVLFNFSLTLTLVFFTT